MSRVAQTSMWQCLVDVYRSLGASVVLVDERFAAVSGANAPAGSPADLALDDDAKRRVSRAYADQSATIVSGDGRTTTCTPVVHGGVTVGAVLVTAEAHRLDETQLFRAGSVLARAIEDELVESHDDVALLSRRVAALHQLLHTAADHGSGRDVVTQFGEALSVWEDAEVFGYCTDLNGQHRLEVALPGSDRTSAPTLIEAGRVPHDESVLISRADKEDFGFRSSGETVLATTTTSAGSWLLAMNVDVYAPERFELYLAALRVALPVTLARETARLTWAMMQHFVEATSPDQGAARAIAAMGTAIGAAPRLSVWTADGRLALAIGGAIQDDERSPRRNASTLRARIETPARLQAVIDARQAEGCGFTLRELTLFDAAVDNVRAWLASAGANLTARPDRRRGQRAFEEFVDRYVHGPAAGDHTALILVSPSDAAAPPQSTHEWVHKVRAHLRPTDLAGRLASGDVAVIALDTPPAGAVVVAQRIAQILGAMGQPGQPVVRVGAAIGACRWSDGEAAVDRSHLQIIDSSPTAG